MTTENLSRRKGQICTYPTQNVTANEPWPAGSNGRQMHIILCCCACLDTIILLANDMYRKKSECRVNVVWNILCFNHYLPS